MEDLSAWPMFNPRILDEFDAYLAGQEGELLSTELMQIFFARGPDLMQRLLLSFEQCSHSELAFAAHSLKSSADNVGLTRLARVCEELEYAGKKTAEFAGIATYKSLLPSLLDDSMLALKRHMADRKQH